MDLLVVARVMLAARVHIALGPSILPSEQDDARDAIEGGQPVKWDPVFGVTQWSVPNRAWALITSPALLAGSGLEATETLARVVVAGGSEVALEGAARLPTSPRAMS